MDGKLIPNKWFFLTWMFCTTRATYVLLFLALFLLARRLTERSALGPEWDPGETS